jgi:hypothetical protein
MKCKSEDITVYYQYGTFYKYRNKTKNHIYIIRLKKKAINSNENLILTCNRCGNKVVAHGGFFSKSDVLFMESYNPKCPDKIYRNNSKYHIQCKNIFYFINETRQRKEKEMENYACAKIHVFFDERKKGAKNKHIIHVEQL